MPTPFEGLRPAAGRDHVAWVVEAMTGRKGIDFGVPDCFEAHVRIHHRIHNGERWADFAPEYLVRGVDMYDYIGSKLEFIDGDGNLDAEDVDALVPLLAAATMTPNECHYALWEGWGWVRPGSRYVGCQVRTSLVLERPSRPTTRRWHRRGRSPHPAPWSRGGEVAT